MKFVLVSISKRVAQSALCVRASSYSDTIRDLSSTLEFLSKVILEKMGLCYMGSPMSRKLSLLFSLGVMLT